MRCLPTRPHRDPRCRRRRRSPSSAAPARPVALAVVREVFDRRIVRLFRLLLGVEVVEVAEELVEPVHRRQELVAVAEVVLAELSGGVAERLEQLGDRRVLGLQPDRRPGYPDLAQPSPVATLAGDERRPAGRAALLRMSGEAHPLVGEAVDVGRAIAHQAIAVATQVGDPDVVTPDDEDVGSPCGTEPPLEADAATVDGQSSFAATTRDASVRSGGLDPRRHVGGDEQAAGAEGGEISEHVIPHRPPDEARREAGDRTAERHRQVGRALDGNAARRTGSIRSAAPSRATRSSSPARAPTGRGTAAIRRSPPSTPAPSPRRGRSLRSARC